VLLLQGQPTVFVVERGGFEPRAVEVGERAQGYAVLKSGVAAGESVVVSGAYALKARLLKSQIGAE
jgi:cobalt-zinc-cadmium efflux system membrane fusion protein